MFVLDGGRLAFGGAAAARMSDDGAYADRMFDMPVPCFLIRHPEGDLLWDTGLPQGRSLEAWAMPGPDLVGQLDGLGCAPPAIRFLALSHGHFDHAGNARLFDRSTWLVNPAEREYMFNDEARGDTAFADYAALEDSARLEITDDHDVFGDGSVLVIQAPGHTPGHCALLVRLPEAGPILLSGDLWHLAESRVHRRMPMANTDRAQTLASMDRVEAILRETGARLIIQHERSDGATLPRLPEGLH